MRLNYQQQHRLQHQKKSSLPFFVMTGMVAAVVTIVGQSLVHPASYRAQGYVGDDLLQDPIGQIEMLVTTQQAGLQRYLVSLGGGSSLVSLGVLGRQDILSSYEQTASVHSVADDNGGGSEQSSSERDDNINSMSGTVSYDSLQIVKKRLSQQVCNYDTPIDNTDPRTATIIEWGLERCLITLSHTRKVNPTDHLTHRTMRMIAERAGFIIKTEHMTDNVVTRQSFYNFVYALQQHHQIGDLPVVSLSDPVTRIEWLSLLYRIFEGVGYSGSTTADVVMNTIDSQYEQKEGSGLQSGISIADFKSQLQSQGYQIQIMPYDADIVLTPEIMKGIMDTMDTLGTVSETNTTPGSETNSTPLLSSVGIDKDMVKQTLSRLIEKI